MSLKYNGKMIPRAQELRREMTRQERHLWYDYLRDYPLRFQRQKTIGSYIVDFFCHDAGIVVELDGSQHYEKHAKAYDDARTEFLKSASLEVIRFPNAAVDHDFEGVCMAIDRRIKEKLGK